MSTTIKVDKKTPGPKKSWLGLGYISQLKNDPIGFMQGLRDQYEDIAFFHIINVNIYLLFSPKLIREAIVTRGEDFIRHERTMDVFTSIYGRNVLTVEGDVWKRQRRILTPGFAPKKIAGYMGLMADAISDCFTAILPKAGESSVLVDIDQLTTKLTADVILRVLFSYKASAEESLSVSGAVRSLEHQTVRELGWPMTPTGYIPFPGRKQKQQHKAIIDNLIQGQIQRRRAAINDPAKECDYLHMLLSARDEEGCGESAEERLSEAEIHDNCAVIFAAGHDTTAAALTWWIGFLTQHRDYADKARQEIQQVLNDRDPTAKELTELLWVNATIKETMRICPVVFGLFNRRAIRDVKIGEWHIPKGATVSVPTWHVHRDPRWYPEPDKFQPDRFMPGAPKIPRGAYLPFGIGPHVCIGQSLAMTEMMLICISLLRQFDFEFAEGQSLPKPKAEALVKPEVPLKIIFTPR